MVIKEVSIYAVVVFSQGTSIPIKVSMEKPSYGRCTSSSICTLYRPCVLQFDDCIFIVAAAQLHGTNNGLKFYLRIPKLPKLSLN